ncbi:hypothetical protein KIN20_032719 [Parelaphostrongylus tenuis]|uniref:Uncharacterized protein n=1 Tax=Parelaphostrongylus tenuis TaxID=148309 RepID=A0AAD5WI85_PARTN|nr:hypothetical protein KIN20_032719 [Parelaphostrongylus tenuis]
MILVSLNRAFSCKHFSIQLSYTCPEMELSWKQIRLLLTCEWRVGETLVKRHERTARKWFVKFTAQENQYGASDALEPTTGSSTDPELRFTSVFLSGAIGA